MYEKVGRLKPDPERDCVRVIVDGMGEIGTSGLWSAGNYSGVRSMSGNLATAMTDISGAGMVSLNSIPGR